MDPMMAQFDARERAIFFDQLRYDPEMAEWFGLPASANPRALIGNQAHTNGFFDFLGPKTLKLGDSGGNVTRLQQMLQVYNRSDPFFPPVVISGTYDAATKEAVLLVQKMKNFPATGEADANTVKAVEQDYLASGGAPIQTTGQKTTSTIGGLIGGLFGGQQEQPAAYLPPTTEEPGPNYLLWGGVALGVVVVGGLLVYAVRK